MSTETNGGDHHNGVEPAVHGQTGPNHEHQDGQQDEESEEVGQTKDIHFAFLDLCTLDQYALCTKIDLISCMYTVDYVINDLCARPIFLRSIQLGIFKVNYPKSNLEQTTEFIIICLIAAIHWFEWMCFKKTIF